MRERLTVMNAQFQKTGENIRFHRLNERAQVDESTERRQREDVGGEHARDAREGTHVHERLRERRLACEHAADTLAHLRDRWECGHRCCAREVSPSRRELGFGAKMYNAAERSAC